MSQRSGLLNGPRSGIRSADAGPERSETTERAGTVTIGRILDVQPSGTVLIEFARGSETGITAGRALTSIRESDIGAEVAVMFEDGEFHRAIVIGLVRNPGAVSREGVQEATGNPGEMTVRLVGRKLSIAAGGEIEIRCGKASIRLSEDGTIRLHGTNVVSRASGQNKIKGASVHIN